MTWQPIATAPKDGTRVLAVNVKYGNVRVSWFDRPHETWAAFSLISEPTHWMPLPDPPPT